MRNKISWSVRDVLVGVLLVLIFAGVALSARQRSREWSNRVKCAGNLRMIGQALLLYANDNKGGYPRTIRSTDQEPVPTWGTPYATDAKLGPVEFPDAFADDKSEFAKYRPAANDVTAAMFLLLRTEDITAAVFVCPSTGQTPWDFQRSTRVAQNWSNWAGNDVLAKHLSYSMQNPYGGVGAIEQGWKWNNTLPADYAMAADMNPGGDGVVKVTIQSPASEMTKANSLNHGSIGQNVLYGDGHIEFQNHPFCSTQRDNIYTANGPEIQGRTGPATVNASPVDPSDSILLPTAADIGFKMPPEVDVPPIDLEKFKADLPGVYFRGPRAQSRSLTINDKTISFQGRTLATKPSTANPQTLAFSYTVVGQDSGDAILELITHENETAKAYVSISDGRLYIFTTGPARTPLDGDWLKK